MILPSRYYTQKFDWCISYIYLSTLNTSLLNRSQFDAFDSGKGVGRGSDGGGNFGDQDRGAETGEHNDCDNLFHFFSPR